MQKWISHSIAPMGIILLFVFIIIYFSSDFISKKILQAFNLILIILLLLYLSFGIYSLVLASQQSIDSAIIKNSWTLLSAYSKIYYYSNDISVLYQTYFLHMNLTGSLFLFIFTCGFFLVIFTNAYIEKIDKIWRPPLRSKLRDERAERYIDFYSKYNNDYKILMEMQKKMNKNFNENKNIGNNIINNNAENLNLINQENNLQINKIENENNNVQIYNQIDDKDKLSDNGNFNNVNSDSNKKLLSNENKIIELSNNLEIKENNVKNLIDNSENQINNDERSKILEDKTEKKEKRENMFKRLIKRKENK